MRKRVSIILFYILFPNKAGQLSVDRERARKSGLCSVTTQDAQLNKECLLFCICSISIPNKREQIILTFWLNFSLKQFPKTYLDIHYDSKIIIFYLFSIFYILHIACIQIDSLLTNLIYNKLTLYSINF